MDPNLLPENLREREVKELKKSHKSVKNWQTELYIPQKEINNQQLISSDTSGGGFWSNLLGLKKPARQSSAIKLTEPKIDKPMEKGFNLLDSPIESLLEPIDQKSDGWLGGVFGKPVSPIISKSSRSLSNRTTTSTNAQLVDHQSKRDFIAPKPPVKASQSVFSADTSSAKDYSLAKIEKNKSHPDDSWLSILSGMFSGSGKNINQNKYKFAKINGTSSVEAVKKAPIAENREAIKPSIKSRESTKNINPQTTPIKPQKHFPKKDRSVEFGINLMPHDWRSADRSIIKSAIPYSLFLIIMPLTLLLAGYLGIHFINNLTQAEIIQKKSALSDITSLLGDFTVRTEQNNIFANKAKVIKGINDQKNTWGNLFSLLEKYTLDGVYYNNFSSDTSGALVLPGVAQDYQILARQLAVLRDATDFVKEAKISNAQLYSEGRAGTVGVSFQLKLVLQDGVFKSKK